MEAQLAALTREIYVLAKGEFNINSPPQLREVLFDRLGMKSGKKTAKTRAASTAEEVLDELALVHELPRKIIEYRSVQKLKCTYVDALPQLVNPETGRIHATLQPDGGGHRPHLLLRSQPPEHPHPHRGGPEDPRGVRGRARPPAPVRRLQPDRAQGPGPPLEGQDPHRHLPAGRGRARPHRRARCSARCRPCRRTSSGGWRRWSTTRSSTGSPPSPSPRTSG